MAEQRSARAATETRRPGWSETHSLLIVVFVCGAVLMAFEMVGSRILQPTFGTTVYVWGSLIGVFLGALSLGYFLGGRLADRVPSFFLLGIIIAIGGLIILAVPFYAPAVCQWIDRGAPGRSTNPLIVSMILFFVPSVLMGTVSPFSVRLQARSVATMGNVAGRLYSLSTLGSIAGTVLATFWMIPSYGTSNITRSLGVALIVISLLAVVPRLHARVRAGSHWAATAGKAAVLVALYGAALAVPRFVGWTAASAGARVFAMVLGGVLAVTVALAVLLGRRTEGGRRTVRNWVWRIGLSVALGVVITPMAAGVLHTDEASSVAWVVGSGLIIVSLLLVALRIAPRWGWDVAGLTALLVVAGFLLTLPCPSFLSLEPGEQLVAEADSPYQHIGVVLLSRSFGGPQEWSLRMMFDKYIESEIMVESGDPRHIRIREPYTSGAKYTDMLQLPFVFNPDARNVLIVGGGGGVLPTILARDYPRLDIDVVEIDPVVVELARRYFGFRPNEGRTHTTLMDGRVFLRDCRKRYDIIILDAFTGGRPPFHMLTREFLELVKTRLSGRGVVQLNVISAFDGEMGRLYRAALRTFLEVFGPQHHYVFPKWYDPRWGWNEGRRREGMNIMILATNFQTVPNPLPREEIVRRADELVRDGRIKMQTIREHARNYQPDETKRDLSADPVLTDDRAPVDTMVTD